MSATSNFGLTNQSPTQTGRPVGNFFGPFFHVKFYAPNPSPTPGASPFAPDGVVTLIVQNIIQQAAIDSRNLGNIAANMVIQFHPGVALLTLTLTPTYQEALDLIKSRIFQYGGVVGVKWGYAADNLITKEYVFIINQPKVTFGRDITFTISGIDAFSHVLKHRTPNIKYSRDQYPQDILLLEKLAESLRCKLDVMQISRTTLASPTHPVQIIKTTPFPQAKTDRELFLEICKGDNIVFHTKYNNTIVMYDRRNITSSPIDYTFFWYDQAQSNGDIPMSNFTTNPLPTIFAPPSFVNSLHTTVDTDTGQTKFEIFDTSKDPQTPLQGDPKTDKTVAGTADQYGQVIQLEDGFLALPSYKSATLIEQLQVGQHTSYPQNANSGLDRLRNEGRDASLMANTTATITSPGHPDVVPPMNIFVRGVGDFDGPYYIISAKHTVGTSGYDMHLELLKTVSSSGNRPVVIKEPPETNTTAPTPTKGPNDT